MSDESEAGEGRPVRGSDAAGDAVDGVVQDATSSDAGDAADKVTLAKSDGVVDGQVVDQKTTNPGHRLGVALGYKINDRFNIELGLQREYLNFYSNGKYVDTSLLKIRKNTDVEKLDASSKITSVPITLRYNFLSKGNGYFFAAVGINAVIITHSEHYNYDVLKNGIESNLSKKYNAVRNPKYFAGVNVSAGYQAKISDLCSIKVEPYYQAPVNDFGVGRMPVSNFGINIGIVKDLK